MTTYERVENGQVVERVTPVPGGHEDTRIGVAVLERVGGWQVHDPASAPPVQTLSEKKRRPAEET